MPSPSEPTPEQMLEAMGRTGRAHVSVSRGALPFVMPCGVRVAGGHVVVETAHPSVTRGAQRRDVAAVQVEALIDGTCWSISVTGPLAIRSTSDAPQRGDVVLPTREALFSAECLSSAHGHRVDPLLRSGLAERA